jgi:hypothetical protein
MTIAVEVPWLLPTTGQVQIFARGNVLEHLDDCDSMALSN